MWKLWTARLLWITHPLQAIALRNLRRRFHITHPLFTGICALPVGGVGNLERSRLPRTRFSKTPDSPHPDLENLAPLKLPHLQPLWKNSHISSANYGYYYFLFLFLKVLYYP